MHTICLSNLESKCIGPGDLKDCSDVEGFYKLQKNTCQSGEEDFLRKVDILFNINGETLYDKNKIEVASKLCSFEGTANVSILRRTNSNCFVLKPDQIPYHNGIFAQNSIKLAMRKYEKPSIKSNSEADILVKNNNTSLETEKSHEVLKGSTVECKEIDDEPILSSLHSDNWLLYNKKSSQKYLTTKSLSLSESQNCLDEFTANIDLLNSELNAKNLDKQQKDNKTAPILSDENNDTFKNDQTYFDHMDSTVRSLTSSSCHSERSIVHLHCVVCFDEGKNEKIPDFKKDEESSSESEENTLKNEDEIDELDNFTSIQPTLASSQSSLQSSNKEASSKFISTCKLEIKSTHAEKKSHTLKIVKGNVKTDNEESKIAPSAAQSLCKDTTSGFFEGQEDIKNMMEEMIEKVLYENDKSVVKQIMDVLLDNIEAESEKEKFMNLKKLMHEELICMMKKPNQTNLVPLTNEIESQIKESSFVPPPAPPLPEKLFASTKAPIFYENLNKKSEPMIELGNSENVNNILKLNPTDRWNTLITARPYNIMQSLSNKQFKLKSALSYCKTLNSIKKQNNTYSKLLLSQAKNFINKSTNRVKPQSDKSDSDENCNFITSGINTLKQGSNFSKKGTFLYLKNMFKGKTVFN